MCSIHDFPYNAHNKMSQVQAAAIIQERLMCRRAVAKVRLLFEGGFYSRAAFYTRLHGSAVYTARAEQPDTVHVLHST